MAFFHRTVDLSPRDDLESLSYVGLFLARSDLPWRNGPRYEPMKRSIKRIRDSKARSTGTKLGAGLEPEFGDLLNYSRGLGFDQIADYGSWNSRFEDIVQRLGIIPGEPLDWTPGEPRIALLQADESSEAVEADDATNEGADDPGSELEDGLKEQFQNSYYGYDIDCWDFIQGERDQDLTMPPEFKGKVDNLIPRITEVITRIRIYDL
jgi:hypothetical protein